MAVARPRRHVVNPRLLRPVTLAPGLLSPVVSRALVSPVVDEALRLPDRGTAAPQRPEPYPEATPMVGRQRA